jgi:hypothetical protein
VDFQAMRRAELSMDSTAWILSQISGALVQMSKPLSGEFSSQIYYGYNEAYIQRFIWWEANKYETPTIISAVVYGSMYLGFLWDWMHLY